MRFSAGTVLNDVPGLAYPPQALHRRVDARVVAGGELVPEGDVKPIEAPLDLLRLVLLSHGRQERIIDPELVDDVGERAQP